MANNVPITPGVGVSVTTVDLSTFTAYPATGELPASCLYVGALVSAAPTPVSNANPLPVAQQGAADVSDRSARLLGHVTVDAAPTTAVTGTFWQATQPVSAAALPLPAGASTAAKQPALGTAGAASADVLTVQGVASMTALKVDGSGVTQPVSNASLPLPAGASTEATLSAINTKVTAVNTGAVVLAAGAAKVGTVTTDQTTHGTTDLVAADLTKVNGTTVVTGGVAGSQGVGGLGAAGAALAGNPVLLAGSDGLNAQYLGVDSANAAKCKPKTLAVTGTGAALNDTPIAATDGGDYRWVSVQLTGTFVATVLWEISNDSVNWVIYALTNLNSLAKAGSLTGPGIVGGPLSARYFRARVSAYTSGTVTATAQLSAAPSVIDSLGVDTELPAAAALADGVNPTAPAVGSFAHVYGGGSTWNRQTASVGDGMAGATITAAGMTAMSTLTGWDRWRNNQDATLLASAARTATTASADQTNFNGRGTKVILNVTANASAAGITVQLQGKDLISGNYYNLNAAAAAVTGTGTFVYDLYPTAGATGGGITQFTNAPLPRTWRVNVVAGDASSVTYSVSGVTTL